MYVYVCVSAGMCIQEHAGAQGSQKRALDPTGAGVMGGTYVVAGNLTPMPWKSSKHSQPLRHLPGPMTAFLIMSFISNCVTH